MTGKGALVEIRRAAKRNLLNRQVLGLPLLAASPRVERVNALIDRDWQRAEGRATREQWTRWHQANADRLNGLLDDPVDTVAAAFTPAELVCACGKAKLPCLFICWTCGNSLASDPVE